MKLKSNRRLTRGFTLVELLLVMAILTILAALTMAALNNLGEKAKEERTKTIIKRIDQVIMEKWESYRTRPLPLRMPAGIKPGDAAVIRLRAIRDLQRMELPERATDIDPKIGPNATNPTYSYPFTISAPVQPINLTANLPSGNTYPALQLTPPAAFRRYYRTILQLPTTPIPGDPTKNPRDNWGDTYAQSECLYLILSGIRDGDRSALDFLSPSEIGDLDNDGLKEILDGWGQPIWFMRWAPGFTKENGALTLQTSVTAAAPDPFDPYGASVQMETATAGYALRPLIVSGGQNKLIDLYLEYNKQNDRHKDIRYADPVGSTNYPLKIYTTATVLEGTPDLQQDGTNDWIDNITNHYVETP